MLEYTLTRSRRKTIAAYVREDGAVEVRAPMRVPRAEIDEFVRGREEILRKYIDEQLARAEKKREFVLREGSVILFLGREYTIRHGDKTRIGENEFFVTEGSVKNQVTALYREAAERIIREKTAYFASVTGNVPSSVRINAAKTRWGSCSRDKSVRFSWFLIMADEKDIDYVIIHELSHIRHMDHSPAFWREVAKYEPDYKRRRSELRTLSQRLMNESW